MGRVFSLLFECIGTIAIIILFFMNFAEKKEGSFRVR